MINVLLEGYDIDAVWLYDELKKYITGAILVDNGSIKLIGNVKTFDK